MSKTVHGSCLWYCIAGVVLVFAVQSIAQDIDYSKYKDQLPEGYTPDPEMLKNLDLSKYRGRLPPGFKFKLPTKDPATDEAAAAEPGADDENAAPKDAEQAPKPVNPAPTVPIKPSPRRNVTHPCVLHPWYPDMHGIVKRHITNGAKLLEYNFRFREYNRSRDPLVKPLLGDRYYQPGKWMRVLSEQGKSLLSLAFHYDVLSVHLLEIGVEKMYVDLVEEYAGCFARMPHQDQITLLRDFVMTDFQIPGQSNELWLDDGDYVCHQIVQDSSGQADFGYECCMHGKQKSKITCSDENDNKWINLMYSMLGLVKIAFLLFGPLFLQKCIYSDSIHKVDYVLHLKEALRKTILVKKVRVPDDHLAPSIAQRKEMKQFKKFRRLVKHIPSDEIVPVKFNKLHIQVDHRKLVSENSVPVGLMHFLWTKFFRCGIKEHTPFTSCCQESIFGSWSPRFLWIPLMKKFYCNLSWRQSASWGHLFNLLGGLLLMLAIPIPYYIRLVIFYSAEEEETSDRRHATEELGLDPVIDHNLFQYLTPTHGGLVIIYIIYCVSCVLLALFRACNEDKFDSLVLSALQDMRSVARGECLRLLLAHIMLPLEKFGICGLVIGAVYWPLVLPLCLLVCICYSIPSIYIIGRLLIHERPRFLNSDPTDGHSRNRRYPSDGSLTDGVNSIENCLMLSRISPTAHEPRSPNKNGRRPCSLSIQIFCNNCSMLLTGFVCILWMLTVLIIYAECFGALLEICALILIGAIVNANTAANYVILAFWLVVYMAFCYNEVYNDYLLLNRKLFYHIKDRLKADVREVLNQTRQKNTAYKHFTNETLVGERRREIDFNLDEDDGEVSQQRQVLGNGQGEETIEYINGKLHWDINNLILFISKQDVPRIPKALFRRVCELDAPACPGPVYVSLLRATRQLVFMLLFLFFVFVGVMAFGNVYMVSSTNQILITLSAGLIPFGIRLVLRPKKAEIDLSLCTFEGKINETIRKFHQSWPVFDLFFEPLNQDPMGAYGGGACAAPQTDIQSVQPTVSRRGRSSTCYDMTETTMSSAPDVIDQHVDLFITIKDETDEAELGENLRSEPASFGSRLSLHSGNRTSPDDPGNTGAPVSSMYTANNPTNATREICPSRSVSVQASMGKRGSPGPTTVMQHGKSVDLVVDISRGGLPQVRSETNRNDSSGNGMQLMPISSQYKKMTNNDESSL